MVLGFHYHIPAYQKDGKIYTMSLQGLFIDSLAQYCKEVVLFLYTPTSNEVALLDYEIKSSNVELVELIPHLSVPKRILQAKKVTKIFKANIHKIDILLLRAPTPLLPFIVKAIRKRVKYSYLIVGYMLDYLDQFSKPTLKNIGIKLFFRWMEGNQAKLAKDALVFPNSTVMYNMYNPISKKIYPIKTTTLSKEDFYYREDTCLGDVYDLLYAGRIDESKGVLEITKAVAKLNAEGVNCRFNLVGWSEGADNTEEKIKTLAAELAIAEKVVLHGKKSVGPELFSFYRNADIFVIASTAEGFPRTIWEALASSTPVIASPVGSIPFYLKDGHDALFVKTRDADDIYEKIKSMVTDGNLRRSLIKNGHETVKEVTLEIQSEIMCREMEKYISAGN